VTAVMKGNRKRDTKPEIAIRSALHARGLRFRKDFPIRPDDGRLIRADIVFPRSRVVVFVDGCFWHQCPVHGNSPRRNQSYWGPKLRRNVERDAETNRRLRHAGWQVVRIWEHEDPLEACLRVEELLEPRRSSDSS